MKNILLGAFITTFVLTSCDNNVEADFEIENATKYRIDSLKIEPNIRESGKYVSLKTNEKVKYKTDMTPIKKTDGAYQISYFINGQKKTQSFGYYTNGYPLEKITKIKIEKDTILIDQVIEKY